MVVLGLYSGNPGAVADLVEMSKQEGIIDFASARLVAAGIVGKLDMRNTREMLLHRSRYIALHYLHVVDIVLNKQIIRLDIGDDLGGLLCPVEEEPGNIQRIDRFYQETDAFPGKGVRGEPQILQQHLVQLGRVRAGRRDTTARTIHLTTSDAAIDGAPNAVSVIHQSGGSGMMPLMAFQLPAGRLCSACVKPYCCKFSTSTAFSKSCKTDIHR